MDLYVPGIYYLNIPPNINYASIIVVAGGGGGFNPSGNEHSIIDGCGGGRF